MPPLFPNKPKSQEKLSKPDKQHPETSKEKPPKT
jgi:hypothetical protein